MSEVRADVLVQEKLLLPFIVLVKLVAEDRKTDAVEHQVLDVVSSPSTFERRYNTAESTPHVPGISPPTTCDVVLSNNNDKCSSRVDCTLN